MVATGTEPSRPRRWDLLRRALRGRAGVFSIKQHSEEVWRLVQQDAVIFVCGEAARSDGEAWLTGLIANHRYVET